MARRAVVWIGIDVGKRTHHACAVDAEGKVVFSRKVGNDQAAIEALLDRASAAAEDVRWAIDLTNSYAALLQVVLTAADQRVVYVPGRVVNRMSGVFRGEAKTDARDAKVIADTARMSGADLTVVTATDETTAEPTQLSSGLVSGGNHGEVGAGHAGGVGDDLCVAGVGLGLPTEHAAHPVDDPPGNVDHPLVGCGEDDLQQRGIAVGQIDRPPHVLGRGGRPIEQSFDRGLVVADLAGEHNLALGIDSAGVVGPFPDVDPDPDHCSSRHEQTPVVAVHARGQPAIRSLISDGSHQIRISGQACPERRGGHSFRATEAATAHQPHPVVPGIRGINPEHLRP